MSNESLRHPWNLKRGISIIDEIRNRIMHSRICCSERKEKIQLEIRIESFLDQFLLSL